MGPNLILGDVVMWVFFDSFFPCPHQLLTKELGLQNKTCVAYVNKNWDSEAFMPWFSYGYQKCMFVDSLLEYVYSSISCDFWV